MGEVSFTQILGDLAAEFGHPPGGWLKQPMRQFQAWVAELGRRRRRELEAHQAAQERADLNEKRDAFFRSHGVKV